MPKLTDLDARFVRYERGPAGPEHGRTMPDGTTQWGGFETTFIRTVPTLAEAHGIFFLCPACFVKNGGAAGTHLVDVTFADHGARDEDGSHNSQGQPSRWQVASGTGLDDLVLEPSIQIGGPCAWHGFVGSRGVPSGEAA